MIRGETIVCFAPDRWDDVWRNRHQIMTRLARENTVVYVEPRPYLREALGRFRSGGASGRGWRSATRREEGLMVYRPPLYAPIIGRRPLSAASRALRDADLRRVLRGLGAGRPIVWLFRPDQDDVPGTLSEKLCVYHIVDDYSGYVGVSAARREAVRARERRLMARADLVFVTSEELLASRQGVNARTYWVPNAVDLVAYSGAVEAGRVPDDLARVPEPRIGYAGAVNDKLDFRLLRRIAEGQPDWSVVLVGPWGVREDSEAASLRELPNVHVLGPKAIQDVPGYVVGLDVCLLPYKRNEWTRHIDPLKLYEYLAAGRPIVSTDIPAVRARRGLVTIAGDEAAFVEGIKAALLDISPERAAERSATVREHTWDARVEALSGHISAALAELERPRASDAGEAERR